MTEHATLTLGGTELEVVDVDGHEAISQLFAIRVRCRAVGQAPRPKEIVGGEASLDLFDSFGSTRGVKAIVARVYHTASWLDGRECIVLDYSKTSLLARKIRDEIRLIDPATRLYLGKVWWGKTRLIDFALKFPQ